MERLRPSPDVDWVEVDGELIVRQATTGDVHLLSSTAAVLWPFFDGETAIDELADDVADAFGIARTRALADIESFAREMRHRRLLVTDAEPSSPPDHATRSPGETRYPVMPPDP